MPLETQIIRNNKPLPVKWSEFHVAAMVCAAAWDSGQGPWEINEPAFEYSSGQYKGKSGFDYPEVPAPLSMMNCFQITMYPAIGATPLSREGYVLKNPHKFLDCSGLAVAGEEIFELLPGDKLVAYRGYK